MIDPILQKKMNAWAEAQGVKLDGQDCDISTVYDDGVWSSVTQDDRELQITVTWEDRNGDSLRHVVEGVTDPSRDKPLSLRGLLMGIFSTEVG